MLSTLQLVLIVLAALAAGPLTLVLGAWLLRRGGLHGAAPLPGAGAPALPLPITAADVVELRGDLAAVRAEWKAHQKQLDAYLDAFEDLEESVERRRRRAAASRSKVEQVEEQPAISPREAARQRARAMGYRV